MLVVGSEEDRMEIGGGGVLLLCRLKQAASWLPNHYMTTLGSYAEVRLGSHLGNFLPFETSNICKSPVSSSF